MRLQALGKSDAAKVVRDVILGSPSKAEQYRESIGSISKTPLSPDAALSKVKKKGQRRGKYRTSKIYEAEIIKLYDRGLDFITSIPKSESVETVLARQRYNAIEDPVDCGNIDCPVNISNLEDDSSSLLVEDGVDKKTQTYGRFMKLLNTHTNWNPISIKIDIKGAAILAIKRVLLNVKISGCNFQFNQCLWRKVRSIGLLVGYGNDESRWLHIRMCASPAFVQVSNVVEG
ncbi:hypothetical protein JTB14_025603 [Gonioctena quinquepunctata]|nr:hypothetical protein JTB14_025603 [Gonioctena quinquepunctata]